MAAPRTKAPVTKPKYPAERTRARRGAALIIVIAIMTILLAIALTFFTTANVEVRVSTNIANSVRAGFIRDSSFAIAESQLNQDFLHNATATSLDHPWRSLFSGAAFVGKPWARFKGQALTEASIDGTRQPGLPEFNFSAVDRALNGPLFIRFQDGVVEPLFQGSRSKQWLYIPRYQGPSPATGGHNALVLYGCVTLVGQDGNDIIQANDPNYANDYAALLSGINSSLATVDLFLAYYDGLDTHDCLQDLFTVEGAAQLPKVTDADVPFVTSAIYGRVLDAQGKINEDGTSTTPLNTRDLDNLQYPDEQISAFVDRDNDENGQNDSIWIPIPSDLFFPQDAIDNNLNGWVDEQLDDGINNDAANEAGDMFITDSFTYTDDGVNTKQFNDPEEALEPAVFVYDGSQDGLDNDGNGLVDADDPNENGSRPNKGLFLTAPLPDTTYYLDLNADGVAYDLVPDDAKYLAALGQGVPPAEALQASMVPLRVTLPGRVRVLYKGTVVELGPEDVDTIDNDYDLVVNDSSAYCYVGPNTLPQPFRPPFESSFDSAGDFVQTFSTEVYNSYLSVYTPATFADRWLVATLPPSNYYDVWRAPGNWFQPTPVGYVGQNTPFNDRNKYIGDPVLFDKARRKAYKEINTEVFDLNQDGIADLTFTPRNIRLHTLNPNGSVALDQSYDLNTSAAFLNAVHITSSGEPVCELAGRAAILITPESSKVNLNVAGGHTYNDEYPVNLGDRGDTSADGDKSGPLSQASLGQGTHPFEYQIRMIPQVGPITAARLWAGRMGSPRDGATTAIDAGARNRNNQTNTLMFHKTGDRYESAIVVGNEDYSLDAAFPGYGRVDDNADALLASLNGRDDDGDGLIDEGFYLPPRLRPTTADFANGYPYQPQLAGYIDNTYNGYRYSTYRPFLSRDADAIIFNGSDTNGDTYGTLTTAYATDPNARNLKDEIDNYLEYFNRLGNLEGIDDPEEFQISNALRNLVAERDGADNNLASNPASDYVSVTDENGELGDRVYTDINEQEIQDRSGFDAAIVKNLKHLLTTYSNDRNVNFLTTAKGGIRALSRIDFNYATPQQAAAALLVKGDFSPSFNRSATIDDHVFPFIGKSIFYPATNERIDTNAYFRGLMRSGENLRAFDPTGDPARGTPGYVNTPFQGGDAITGGVMFALTPDGSRWLPTTTGPAHEIPSDPFLDALQLAANIVDNADRNHARTTLTTELVDRRADAAESSNYVSWPADADLNNRERIPADQLLPTEDIDNYITNVLGLPSKNLQNVDTWWASYVENTANTQNQRRGEERHVSYTVAGREAVKINELMVRPVRRVEAEMIRASFPTAPGAFLRLDDVTIEGNNPLDPMAYDRPYPAPTASTFWTTNFDPAPAFDLSGDGVPDSDPLPDFEMTRQALMPALGNSVNTWQSDVPTPLRGTSANVLGDGVAISNSATPRQTIVNVPFVSLDVPDVIQYIVYPPNTDPNDPYAPPAGLPEGRYYLTINTMDPSTGQATINDADQLDYAIKYVPTTGIQVDKASGLSALPIDGTVIDDPTILGDIARQIFNFGHDQGGFDGWVDDHFQSVPREHIASERGTPAYGEGRAPGWAFLDGTPITKTASNADNYFLDGGLLVGNAPLTPGILTHTVYVPGFNSGVALCIAVKRHGATTTGVQPKISINFFDFSQEPDHEYIELANTSQNAIPLGNWKLEIGIPTARGVNEQSEGDPNRSEWTIPPGTTIAPGGMLLLGFDVFDGFQEPNGFAVSGQNNIIGHNGMGLAGWDATSGAQPFGPDVSHVTVPPIHDVSNIGTAYPQFNNLFNANGRFADPTGSVFTRAVDPRVGAVDYVDRDGDGISSYYACSDTSTIFADLVTNFGVNRQALYTIDAVADDARLENGQIVSTQPYNTAIGARNLLNTNALLNSQPNKPWDRIVQLQCKRIWNQNYIAGDFSSPIYPNGGSQDLTTGAANEVNEIANIVLRGGFLPDYPDHDGIDNDGDGAYLVTANACNPANPSAPPQTTIAVRNPVTNGVGPYDPTLAFYFTYVPGILDKDMIDNNLNGIIDERGPGIDPIGNGCIDETNANYMFPDATRSEGVDEGNLYKAIDESVFVGSDILKQRRYGPGSFEAGLLPAIFFNKRHRYPVRGQADDARCDLNADIFTQVDPEYCNPYLHRFDGPNYPGEYTGISAANENSPLNPLTDLSYLLRPTQDNNITRLGDLNDFNTTTAAIQNFHDAYYMGSDLDPPDWKAFTERRWNPGDDVIVSLYDDSPEVVGGTGNLVDRVTYREYDVINRTIDDVAPCPYMDGDVHLSLFPETNATSIADGLNPPLSPLAAFNATNAAGYPSWWRPNHMGLDFYRSLERKDPDYAGDLYGTSNRWQATDGNYDDWAESLPFFRATLYNQAGAGNAPAVPKVAQISDRFPDPDIAGAFPTPLAGWPQDYARLYRHCIWGSPLRMNLASRLLRNPADLPYLFSSNENGNFNAHFPNTYTVDDYTITASANPIVDHQTRFGQGDQRPFGQFPSHRVDTQFYVDSPYHAEAWNRDWTLYKDAGADRFSHRDLPDDPATLSNGLPADEHDLDPILRAGTALENVDLRGMDEPFRSNADLMRVPMPIFRHDMFNTAFASDNLGSAGEAFNSDPFLFGRDLTAYDINGLFQRLPIGLDSGAFGTNQTDLDPNHLWAKVAPENSTNFNFGRDPDDQNREAPLTTASDTMATNPIILSVGQADFTPIAPAKFEFDNNGGIHIYPDTQSYTDLINWVGTTPPEAWTPVFLYELPHDRDINGAFVPQRQDAFPFYPAYANGAKSGILVEPHFLFSTDYLFPGGAGAPSYFTGASRGAPDPAYGVLPESLDEKTTGPARRAPMEQRVAMYVANNRYLNGTVRMNDLDRADAVFTWDEKDGLENGEYVAYIGTWLPGLHDRAVEADYAARDVANSGNTNAIANGAMFTPAQDNSLSSSGFEDPPTTPQPASADPAIRALLNLEHSTKDATNGANPGGSDAWAPSLQLEFFADRTLAKGMAPIASTASIPPTCSDFSGSSGLLPPECWQPGVTYTANSDGYIFYAAQESGAWQPIVVRVTDNFLALRVRNVGDPGKVAAITHVILAPRKRVPGKIDLNTSQLAQAQPQGGNSDAFLFSSLLGLPGITNDFEKDIPADDNATSPRHAKDSNGIWIDPFSFINDPVPPAPYTLQSIANNQADSMDNYAVGITRQRTRATQLTGLIQAGRPIHANGRYYESPADLVRDDRAYTYDPNDGIPGPKTPLGPDLPNNLYPLSNKEQEEKRFDETERRFSHMANSITTRSDVFEIIATVQAGYGIDANGDGRINYRSPDEFVTTAEARGRVVYERRSPSDTSDRATGN